MMKAEFEEWGTKTTIGVLAGMLYGGLREALGSAVRKKLHLSFLSSLWCTEIDTYFALGSIFHDPMFRVSSFRVSIFPDPMFRWAFFLTWLNCCGNLAFKC
jgi:hypothetical protein